MHEREGSAQGLSYTYRIIDVPQATADAATLASLLDDCESNGFRGLNITHPFKQAVIPLLDALSDDARALGAVNTVVFEAGRRVGHNTDWSGFAENFRRGLGDHGQDRAVLIGAGGAGAAVGHAMMVLGAEHLAIYDVDGERAHRLVDLLADRFDLARVAYVAELGEAVARAQGIINASPIGMAHHPGSPVPAPLLRRDLWIADIVYFPLVTQLLRDARKVGCRTLDGGGMAVFQAAEAFRLFSGIAAESERMLTHFAELTRANLAFSDG